MRWLKRHWQLVIAICIFTFPVGLYSFFRLFASNTYVLPVYLDKAQRSTSADSCQYQIPYNALEHLGMEPQEVDAYVLSPAYSEQLTQIVQRTQTVVQKKHGQPFTIQHIVINEPCMIPLHSLFPHEVPANWAALVDSQGQLRSYFSLMGDKGILQAKNDLYLLVQEAITHNAHTHEH